MRPESFVVISLSRPQRLRFPLIIPRFRCLLYLENGNEEEMENNCTLSKFFVVLCSVRLNINLVFHMPEDGFEIELKHCAC